MFPSPHLVPASNLETYLLQVVANQQMALDTIASALASHLPATSEMVKGAMNQLGDHNRSALNSNHHAMLTGQGTMATHYRRTAMQVVHAEREVVERHIQAQLPKVYNENQNFRPFLEYVWRHFGEFVPKEASAGKWVGQDRNPFGLEPFFKSEEVVSIYSSSIEKMESGFYYEHGHGYNRPKQRSLVIRDSDNNVIVIREGGDVWVWTYVSIEKMWVSHQDARFLDIEKFKARFRETFRDQTHWPKPLTEQEFIAAVKEQLVKAPIESMPFEEWQEKIVSYCAHRPELAYRAMDLSVDFKSVKVLIWRFNDHCLTFHFDNEDGSDVLHYQTVNPKNAYAPMPRWTIDSWDSLPVYNKITLAPNLLDHLARRHDNENRQASIVESSEP